MDRGNYQRGGGDNTGRGRGNRGRGGRGGPQMGSFQPPQQWGNQPRGSGQYQFRGAPHNHPGRGGTWVNQPVQRGGPAWSRPPQQGSGVPSTAWARPPPQQPHQQGSGGGVATAWARPPPQKSQELGGGNQQQQVVDRPVPQSSDVVQVDLGSLKITEPSSSSLPESYKEKRVPVARPDTGNIAVKSITLLANHFPVKFNLQTIIMYYDVDIQQQADENRPAKKLTNKFVLHMIREKLCADKPAEFPRDKTVYDGKKNIFSAVQLPTGCFTVNWSDGDDAMEHSYDVIIKLVAELQLWRLNEYMSGNLTHIPRDILQGMDLVMKENPSRKRISVGRCFYSMNDKKDIGYGAAAHEGFQQSLKPTAGGLALCFDYSILALRKPISVLDYLRQCLQKPNEVTFMNNHQTAQLALKGLKVTVIHRRTSQKFLIKQLTDRKTSEITFPLEDPEGKNPPRDVLLVEYFRDKYQQEIQFKDFPSLDIGKGNKKNYVPMEFCVLVEGQPYRKEGLYMSLARPQQRRDAICKMVEAEDGPCGRFTSNFEIEVDSKMTSVLGRILPPPDLKLGSESRHHVNDKCQWNLVGKSVVEGKEIQRWALINLSHKNHRDLKRQVDVFVGQLKDRNLKLGIKMEEPAVKHFRHMDELWTVGTVEKLLNDVVNEAGQKNKGELQMIVCVMASKDNGYKYLKWVSETKIGIVTQCCLSSNAYNNAKDQFLANLCLKINAKLGGSNMELMERLPNFGSEDNVMFIGADVNHPTGRDPDKYPSIAAVVATINWPAANKYAARVRPQKHRTEKILEFGSMCADLVNTYARLNSVKPNKIVVFRDGVSEGQFDMVLNEELNDLVEAIYDSNKYKPEITLVVAQKRHHTRLFPKEGNVPPGTVVDTQIVHPFDFDFYLCSHFGQLGTSKATHYYVLWDDNGFNSDSLQKLIYNLCFTFARCTKPVSLVPPVYYADLVAYRGRMFQEVLMEMNAPSSTTSSVSFEQSFYKMHKDLQNIMFFV
ncbi:protein argonaute 2-like [Solanum stenotomum]|uniref:protein argonaute 2-like n=1 Tax=Solanum stenotomum TaxID=172797 RepID=UPI0020D1B4E9|nr:protein argonaute 2-like [Solanum stenotomum]